MLKGRLAFAVVALLATAIWYWLYLNSFLVPLDARFQDKLFVPRGASPEIILVTIDNESIQELGVWPFPRSLHAELIDDIAAGDPRVIGYDVTFSEASTQSEDQALADAIAHHNNIVLASEAVLEIRDGAIPRAVSTLQPLPTLVADQTLVGPTTLVPDTDGVIRQVPTAFIVRNNEMSQSFAALVTEAAGYRLTEDTDGLLRVAYVGGPGTYESVSFADVLSGEVEPDVFANKIVLVGATAPDLHDEYLTPFGAGQAMSGVEIQANVVQSLLEGRDVRLLTEIQVAVLFAIIFTLGVALGLFLRLRYLAVAAIAVFIGYLLVAVALAATDLLLPVLHPLLLIVGIFGIDLLYRYRDEYARRQFIQHAFGRYVAPAVVDKLASGEAPLRLGGVKEELTILFSDIRGFTTLSEALRPEELVTFLNEYLTGMTDIVLSHEGTVDKYIGDAVMAFWGAPLPQSDHAVRGVLTALAMRERLSELNKSWQRVGKPMVEIGVGLNTGRVIVGNMGSERRFDYTVIGDDVNLASRLEGLTKYYGVGILVSEATKKLLGDRFVTRQLDKVAVKGKKEAVKIFEVVAEVGKATDAQLDFLQTFEKALQTYYARDWAAAKKMFEQFEDKTSRLFVVRCNEYLQTPPDDAWDGTYIAKEK